MVMLRTQTLSLKFLVYVSTMVVQSHGQILLIDAVYLLDEEKEGYHCPLCLVIGLPSALYHHFKSHLFSHVCNFHHWVYLLSSHVCSNMISQGVPQQL